MTLALINLPAGTGYLILFALIGVESSGVPVPGETALIAAGLLAHDGRFSIELVIVIAAAAAIVGDNIGYLIGRVGGRRLLEAEGPLEKHRKTILAEGGAFFDKHGPKAVFLGRWVAGLRIASAWLAGITHMPWRLFFFWNGLGGIAWATSVGLLSYYLGKHAEEIFKYVGFAGVGIAVVAIGGYLYWRRRKQAQQLAESADGGPTEARSTDAG